MLMKRYIACIAAVLALASCQVQQPDGSQYLPAPELETSTGTLQFDCNGGNNFFSVTTKDAVTATANVDWLTLTVSGTRVDLDVQKNGSIESRYAVVTVSAGAYKRSVQVFQFGVNTRTLWEDNYDVPYTASVLDLEFMPTDETIRLQIDGMSWEKPTLGESTLSLAIDQNPDKEERVATVTFTAGEEVRSFTITQALNPKGSGGGGGGGDVPDGTVLFSEVFEDINTLAELMLLDLDGDGNKWGYDNGSSLAAHSGVGKLFSASYDNDSGPLTPDNWVFTPGISLASSNNYLSFWVVPQDGSYAQEHYGVYVTTTSPDNLQNIYDCQLILEGTLTKANQTASVTPSAVGTWENPVVKIPSEFDGQTVYIAFRHFDCTDWFVINLDEVVVVKGDPSVAALSYAPAVFSEGSYLLRK